MDDQRASLQLDVKETELTSQPLPTPPPPTKEEPDDIRRPLSEEEFIDLLFRSQVSILIYSCIEVKVFCLFVQIWGSHKSWNVLFVV